MTSNPPTTNPTLKGWPRRLRGALSGLAAAALLLGLSPVPARAELVLQVNGTGAAAGGTGSFDVVLMSTGGTFHVSAFSVELSVDPASGVAFTGTDTAASYIFGALQAPPLTFDSFPIHDFTASDSDMTAPGEVILTTGQAFGIEHVTFSVAPGTPGGPVAVSIVSGSKTVILDIDSNLVDFSTTNGSITVDAAAVPEPASLAMLGTGAVAALLYRGRRSVEVREGTT